MCPWQISVQMLLGLLHVLLLTSPKSVLILHAVSLIGLKEQFLLFPLTVFQVSDIPHDYVGRSHPLVLKHCHLAVRMNETEC